MTAAVLVLASFQIRRMEIKIRRRVHGHRTLVSRKSFTVQQENGDNPVRHPRSTFQFVRGRILEVVVVVRTLPEESLVKALKSRVCFVLIIIQSYDPILVSFSLCI